MAIRTPTPPIDLRHQGPDARVGDLEDLLRRLPTALLVVGADDLAIRETNDAMSRTLGYSADELLGRRLDDLIAPGDRERLLRLLSESSATGVLWARSAWDLAHRDGSLVRLEVAGQPILQGGRPCLLLYQPAQAPLNPTAGEPAATRMPPFSFSALHDIKEPLHIIKGYLSLLRQHSGPALDHDGTDYLDQAYAGTLRLQAIVLNLLEFFRTDAQGIAPEPVPLERTLDEAIAALSLQIQEAQASILRDPLPTVLADRFQISRVVQNLLSNAIKFRGKGPVQVHVRAVDHPDEWELVVQDNGIGMEAKDLARVMQPFVRVHSTDKYPGTGLGLSICKKIAELHGGRLWLESRAGVGTTAHLALPKGAAP